MQAALPRAQNIALDEDGPQICRDSDLLNEKQAHDQELPMSLAWYRRKRLLGDGPPFLRIANRIFYRRGALRAWIAAREVE